MKELFDSGIMRKATFELDELDDKTVKLRIVRNEGWMFVCAIEGDRMYVIHTCKGG